MRKLVSPWKDHLINFYEYKKLCGYKYDSTEYVLVMFDQYYANLKIEDMDAIAVTYKPGLLGSLLVGLEFAKTVAAVITDDTATEPADDDKAAETE